MEYTTKISTAVAILLFGVLAVPAVAQTREDSSFNVGLVYPISSNGMRAKDCSNFFSLNAIAGFSRSEAGVSIAGVSNLILENASGLQLAGLFNHVGNYAQGLQVAGFMNTTRRGSSGVQIAGFMNHSGDANVQIGGFINVAKKVKGIQIAGFINIADSSDYPIGIINLVRNGEKSIAFSVDETQTALLSFRSGGRKLYGIIGIGYNDQLRSIQDAQVKKGRIKAAVGEAGIGAHWNLTGNFRLNTELAAITTTDFENGDIQRYVFRLLPDLHFRHFEAFAGPTFNYVASDKGIGANLIKNYTWSKNAGTRNFRAMYFGVTGGITYRL